MWQLPGSIQVPHLLMLPMASKHLTLMSNFILLKGLAEPGFCVSHVRLNTDTNQKAQAVPRLKGLDELTAHI